MITELFEQPSQIFLNIFCELFIQLDAPGTVGRGQISSTPNASSTHEGRELISLGLSCWVYTTLSSNQKAEQSTRQRTAAPELSLRGGERPLHQPAVLYTILPPGRPYGWPCLSACVKRGTNHPPRYNLPATDKLLLVEVNHQNHLSITATPAHCGYGRAPSGDIGTAKLRVSP